MAIKKGLINLAKQFVVLVKLGIPLLPLLIFAAPIQAHQATLTWDTSAEPMLAGYRLYYGEVSGIYTSSIDVGLQTAHTISGLKDSTYYFAVTAYDHNKVESTFSGEVSKKFGSDSYPVPVDPLPSPWLDADIGNTGLVGNASFTSNTLTLSGSGADIWNAADAFHFVYQSLHGDGTIIARITSIENTHVWAKAGVMIRENLDSNAVYAMVAINPQAGVFFGQRPVMASRSYHTAGTSTRTPCWVKLVRVGNNFTSYQSTDGNSWTIISSTMINMATDVYVGLALTSHKNDILNVAKLDNINIINN